MSDNLQKKKNDKNKYKTKFKYASKIKDINALSSIGLVIDSVTIENENGSIFYTIKSKQKKTTKKSSE